MNKALSYGWKVSWLSAIQRFDETRRDTTFLKIQCSFQLRSYTLNIAVSLADKCEVYSWLPALCIFWFNWPKRLQVFENICIFDWKKMFFSKKQRQYMKFSGFRITSQNIQSWKDIWFGIFPKRIHAFNR